jgi:mannosyltransferase OCH1-like enzyme
MRRFFNNNFTIISFLIICLFLILMSIDHSLLKRSLAREEEINANILKISDNLEGFKRNQGMHNDLFLELMKNNKMGRNQKESKKSKEFNFPKKIHFTWKEEFEKLDEKSKEYDSIMKWKKLNPKHSLKYFSDQKSLKYVEKNFENQPNLINIYKKFLKNIFRADLFRYLVVYNEGG